MSFKKLLIDFIGNFIFCFLGLSVMYKKWGIKCQFKLVFLMFFFSFLYFHSEIKLS